MHTFFLSNYEFKFLTTSAKIPDSMTMLGQRWHRVVRLAYGWGWEYNVGPNYAPTLTFCH